MLTFKQFLREAPRKKKVDDDWIRDYPSGYGSVRDMQEYMSWNPHKSGRELQLFVPKRRDPDEEKRRASERRYYQTRREQEAEEAKLKEETIPVLTSFKEQPPGNNKPGNAFWTSTALKTAHGYTSDWYRFVEQRFPEWQTDYGYLFEIKPGARIFDLSFHDRFYEWAMQHDKMSVAPTSSEWIRPFSDSDMRYRFPWDTLAHHFDGVHTFGNDERGLSYGWDVESTAWFDTSVLTYKGAVRLAHHSMDEDD